SLPRERGLPCADGAHSGTRGRTRYSAPGLWLLSDDRGGREDRHAPAERGPTSGCAAPERRVARRRPAPDGGGRSADGQEESFWRRAVPALVLVGAVSYRERLLLPDPVHVRPRRQPRRAPS